MLQLEMRALKETEDMLSDLLEKSQRAVSQRGRGPVNNRVEMASPNRGFGRMRLTMHSSSLIRPV